MNQLQPGDSPDYLASHLSLLEPLANYVGSRETHLLELKAGLDQTDVGKTVAAMCSNEAAEVGLIVLGADEGPPVIFPGVELSDDRIRRVRGLITGSVSPAPEMQIWAVDVEDGQRLICVAVRGSGQHIYEYRGTPYRRVGAENTKLSREEALRLQLQRAQGNRWETLSSNVPVDFLDPSLIKRFTDQVRANYGITRSDEEILREYGLVLEPSVATNAAVALFISEEHAGRVLPQLLFQAGRFADVAALRNPSDAINRELSLIEQFDVGIRFLRDHLPVRSSAGVGVTRVDDLEIPLTALREIFANALVHRDLEAPDGRVAIHVDDREVRIISSGSMVPGINYSFLKARAGELGSRLRNNTICRVFFELRLVERWGGGIKTAVDETLNRFLPAPRFRFDDDRVTVAMLRPEALPMWVADAGLTAIDLLVLDCLGVEPVHMRELRQLTQLSRNHAVESIQRLMQVGAVDLPGGFGGPMRRRPDWDQLEFG